MNKQCNKIDFHPSRVKMGFQGYKQITIPKFSHKANMDLKLCLKAIECCQILIKVTLA
jgi:hypothetical protein